MLRYVNYCQNFFFFFFISQNYVIYIILYTHVTEFTLTYLHISQNLPWHTYTYHRICLGILTHITEFALTYLHMSQNLP